MDDTSGTAGTYIRTVKNYRVPSLAQSSRKLADVFELKR